MRFTHLMLAAWCVAVLCICLCDMGRAAAQLEGQEKPAIKTAYAQDVYGGSCSSDLLSIAFSGGSASCLFYYGQTAPGSEFSGWSRCFSSSDGLTLSNGSMVTAICARVYCHQPSGAYKIKVSNSRQYVWCPAGSKVDLSTYSSLFTSGSITCPPYNDVCSNMPTRNPTPAPVTGGTCSSDLLSIAFSSSTASCLYYYGQTAPGSEFSGWSRCFSSADGLTLKDGSSVTAICAHVHCNTASRTYSLEVRDGRVNAPCPAGTTVALSPYSSLFTSGSITCPSYNDVCGTQPTPTTTPTNIPNPTSSFPTSGAMSDARYSVLTLLGLLVFVIVSAVL